MIPRRPDGLCSFEGKTNANSAKLGSGRLTVVRSPNCRCSARLSAPLTTTVCRAWHVTLQVKVLWPGIRRAEGKEKGKCVVVRRGAEVPQGEIAGR